MATSKATNAATGTERPRFLELIAPNPGIDFVRLAMPMALTSVVVILMGLASIWYRGGLNYGIDFAGGTLVHVKFVQATQVGDVRQALERPELREVVVQDMGGGGQEYAIRVLGVEGQPQDAAASVARAGLQSKFGEGSFEVFRVESVGPKVGKDLWRDAMLAVFASTILMGVYIWFRFDLRFGIGAAAALLHDVLVTLGALSWSNMEFDLTTVAALLTVVGFSVNDTVIISDRIRENLAKMRKEPLATIINTSINETLSRTVITSGTAILVTIALYALGGPVIHSFAFALLVGFVVGTYSSIFIASPIVLWLQGLGKSAA
jgi:preprotein translocase subunit SecF